MKKTFLRNIRESPPITGLFFSVFLIFAAIIIWSAIERKNSFIENQQYIGKRAAINAREAVENAILSRKRYVRLFVEDNIELIRYLIDDPENEELFQVIKQKLSRYIPDLFTINITNNHAELLIDDFEGFTGQVCLNDVLDFANTGYQKSKVHPNHILYHYDILHRFNKSDTDYIFFVSFGLNEIQSALKYSSPEGHRLMLVREIPEPLIEITDTGGRDTIENRLDFRLTSSELDRVLSRTPVDDSDWLVLDMIDHTQIKAFTDKLIFQNIIVFTIFTILLSVVRYFIVSNILRQSQKIHELNDSLKELLLIDGLTGLYNKGYLETQLHKEWSRALRDKKKITVMLIDIDHFKLYNDNYGHIQGDKCLQQVSAVLRDTFQRENDFAARFGGEEFCVVLNDSSTDCPEKLVERFHNHLKESDIKHEFSDTASYITCSVGVSTIVPEHVFSPEMLLQKADECLYKAKNTGRNKTVFC